MLAAATLAGYAITLGDTFSKQNLEQYQQRSAITLQPARYRYLIEEAENCELAICSPVQSFPSGEYCTD